MPARSNTSAVSKWPDCAAKCNGDVPSCKENFTIKIKYVVSNSQIANVLIVMIKKNWGGGGKKLNVMSYPVRGKWCPARHEASDFIRVPTFCRF